MTIRQSGATGSSCFTDLKAHHELGRCLLNDIEAKPPVELKGRIVFQHEQCHRIHYPALLLQQQTHDFRTNAVTLQSGRDAQLLQHGFVSGSPKLNPANILLVYESDDTVMFLTPQVGKMTLLVCCDPVRPDDCKGSDHFFAKVENQRVVGRMSQS